MDFQKNFKIGDTSLQKLNGQFYRFLEVLKRVYCSIFKNITVTLCIYKMKMIVVTMIIFLVIANVLIVQLNFILYCACSVPSYTELITLINNSLNLLLKIVLLGCIDK